MHMVYDDERKDVYMRLEPKYRRVRDLWMHICEENNLSDTPFSLLRSTGETLNLADHITVLSDEDILL